MRTRTFFSQPSLLALFLFFGTGSLVWSQTPPPKESPPPPPPKVKFRPPAAGAPSVRLTGGSRGIGDNTLVLDVLAPDDVGLTTQEQPSLFWFHSKASEATFEITVLQAKQIKPVLRLSLAGSRPAGIQRLDLAEHGVRLTPNIEYQWVVAMIPDAENRSRDLIASGIIKRIEAPAALKEALAKSSPDAQVAAYAEAGIWYDALAKLSDQITSHPTAAALRSTRTDLLRQAGLNAAASFEQTSATK